MSDPTLPTNKASEMAELKACPFCGCKVLATKVYDSTVGQWWAIYPAYACREDHDDTCPLRGLQPVLHATEAEAITAWNTRAPPVTREAVLEEAAQVADAKMAQYDKALQAAPDGGPSSLVLDSAASTAESIAAAIRALKSEPVVDQGDKA